MAWPAETISLAPIVVEATAAQIRELAATPGVQAIRLNRWHRNIRKSDTLGPEGLERKKA